MTPSELRELIQRLEHLRAQATPGEWWGYENIPFEAQLLRLIKYRGEHGDYFRPENVEFICGAANQLPALLREVSELLAENERVRDALRDMPLKLENCDISAKRVAAEGKSDVE